MNNNKERWHRSSKSNNISPQLKLTDDDITTKILLYPTCIIHHAIDCLYTNDDIIPHKLYFADCYVTNSFLSFWHICHTYDSYKYWRWHHNKSLYTITYLVPGTWYTDRYCMMPTITWYLVLDYHLSNKLFITTDDYVTPTTNQKYRHRTINTWAIHTKSFTNLFSTWHYNLLALVEQWQLLKKVYSMNLECMHNLAAFQCNK